MGPGLDVVGCLPDRFLSKTVSAFRDIFCVAYGEVDAAICGVDNIPGETLHVSLKCIEFRAQRSEPFVYVLRAVLFLVISHLGVPFVCGDWV